MASSALKSTSLQAAGLAHCVLEAVQAAQALFKLVPLVLPEDKADRAMRDASTQSSDVLQAAQELVRDVDERLAQYVEVLPDGTSHAGPDSAAASAGMLERALKPELTHLRLELQEVQSGADTGSSAARPLSPTRRGKPSRTVPVSQRLSLQVVSPGERYRALCEDVTSEVHNQASVQTLMAPYHALLEAVNHAEAAVHSAAMCEPSEAQIARLTAASDAGCEHVSGPLSSNALQLKRWGAAVANMQAAVALVRRGFQEACQAAERLDQLELVWVPPPTY